MKCSNCHSEDTRPLKFNELTKLANEKGISIKAGATSGKLKLSGAEWLDIGKLLATLVLKFLEYITEKEKNNPPCLLCKDCGHWETLKLK